MNSSQTKSGKEPAGPEGSASPAQSPDDLLFGDAIFGEPTPTPPPRPAALAPHPEPAPALRLAVKGLKPVERDLLEGLVKVSQRRTPRLQILDDAHAHEADVIVIDTRDHAAMAWTRERPWLAQRAVIWIDGSECAPSHTLLRRPVQWPILPMVLARALERGSGSSDAASGSDQATGPRVDAQHPASVLVVADSALSGQLRSLLEPAGYRVQQADSVAVAMQQLGQHHFDCVLMEALLPQVDGYEGCRLMKARSGADAVRVVMLTSTGSPFDRIRGRMAGCDAYLSKPVDPRHLREVLEQQVTAARETAAHAALRAVAIPTRRY